MAFLGVGDGWDGVWGCCLGYDVVRWGQEGLSSGSEIPSGGQNP